MTDLLSRMMGWRSREYTLCIIFISLMSSACQPVQTSLLPTRFPTLSHQTVPPVESTSTEAVLLPSPTTTEPPTAQPTNTAGPIPLSLTGPWLVYKLHYTIENEHFMVNQDGTGRVRIVPGCDAGDIQASPFNHLVVFPGMIYLFNSAQMSWTLVYSDWPSCRSDYTGDNEKGLLATMTRGAEEEIPELLIYELPSGKIRDRFPVLFKCPDDDEACNTSNVEWGNFEIAWSPNGRYLAFAAALENQPSEFGPSSDLYMYDARTGKVIRLTNGPDSVAQIWWSPDGEWIIMGELHESGYPFTTSVWAVSASNNEMRKLYSIDSYPQGILGWLDNRRFIVYSGTSLYDASDLPAYNLDVVDIDTGKLTALFEGSFFSAALDSDDETVAVYVYITEPRAGYEEGQGIYLISTSTTRARYVGSGQLQPDWNDELKLFVTDEPCENDTKGTLAFNAKGELQCLHPPLPDSYPSPNGQWQVSIRDGTWLQAKDQQPVQIVQGEAVQVIWRPDSEGFFFVADQVLYYVSLPGANLVVVDPQVMGNSISFRWLDGK